MECLRHALALALALDILTPLVKPHSVCSQSVAVPFRPVLCVQGHSAVLESGGYRMLMAGAQYAGDKQGYGCFAHCANGGLSHN